MAHADPYSQSGNREQWGWQVWGNGSDGSDNNMGREMTVTADNDGRVTIGDKWHPATTNSSTSQHPPWAMTRRGGGDNGRGSTTQCHAAQANTTQCYQCEGGHFILIVYIPPPPLKLWEGALNYKFMYWFISMWMWCECDGWHKNLDTMHWFSVLPCVLY